MVNGRIEKSGNCHHLLLKTNASRVSVFDIKAAVQSTLLGTTPLHAATTTDTTTGANSAFVEQISNTGSTAMIASRSTKGYRRDAETTPAVTHNQRSAGNSYSIGRDSSERAEPSAVGKDAHRSSSSTSYNEYGGNVVEARLSYEVLSVSTKQSTIMPTTAANSASSGRKPVKPTAPSAVPADDPTAASQSLLRVRTFTGRKHQIRAQLSHVGFPVVGDAKYGAPQKFRNKEIALHAVALTVRHPITKEKVPTAYVYMYVYVYMCIHECICSSECG